LTRCVGIRQILTLEWQAQHLALMIACDMQRRSVMSG
jgi:hypothetical protein